MRIRLFALAVATLALAACGGGGSRRSFPTSAAGLATTQVHAADRTIDAEIAATPEQRSHGLSRRPSLAADAGMLFLMGDISSPVFWMKDMRFPLDFVLIDADRRVVGVTADAPPQAGVKDSELTLYRPPSPVRYVLEVNAGAAERLGLTTGVQLEFDLPTAPAASG